MSTVIVTPLVVAENRIKRLVTEAKRPCYTTSTGTPVEDFGVTCSCGAPVTVAITFADGDTRFYCGPCS